MSNTNIKDLVVFSYDTLKKVQVPLADFLNEHNAKQLALNETELDKTKGILSDLRHLLVAIENTIDRLGISKRSHQFNKDFAEQVLYETVHHCVDKYYYPAHELYEEDGRYSYTNNDAVKFRFTPHPSIKKLIVDMSKDFETLREELSYYETDYITKKRLQGKNI